MAKFEIAENVSTFCNLYSLNDFLKMKFQKPVILNQTIDMFPLNLVFFREKVGKQRTYKDGYDSHKSDTGKLIFKPRLRAHKKIKTSDQNNFSVYVYYAADPSYLGTINRLVKHKGHGKLVSAFTPSNAEVLNRTDDLRIAHRKYKNFHQLYLHKKIFTKEFLNLTNRLEDLYKCSATGQTTLF